ncbi:MAG: HRDC domain-containing protein [Actinomycetota bacterium]|nr:HRDC domain-containing protein [Actinomycetota bacterium]
MATTLATGSGPVALDAERASGYRYSQRAYLVQLRRSDIGTVLLDPIALGDLRILDPALAPAEWVLHAAGQDLPCLAEIGIRPRTLFDTELAGRLAGLPRVGLGPLVEQMLGLTLQKGHGADDWSKRPLPDSWLVYAALDVEVLVELRDAMEELLRQQGKLDWAWQEFAALTAAPNPPPRSDPWRRTSGMHKISDRRGLAIVRELWTERDRIARRRDIAPHRILPDTAISDAAAARPTTVAELTRLPVFGGRTQRRQAGIWIAAIARAAVCPDGDLPSLQLPVDGPPAPGRWASKDPVAHARLTAARTGLAELAEKVGMPVSNLITPDLVRRILWEPPDPSDVADRMKGGGAREWQIELTSPIVARAISVAPEQPI